MDEAAAWHFVGKCADDRDLCRSVSRQALDDRLSLAMCIIHGILEPARVDVRYQHDQKDPLELPLDERPDEETGATVDEPSRKKTRREQDRSPRAGDEQE